MITSIECCHVHSSESFHSFHRMFYNMPQIIFPEIFYDIPRNVWRHSPEYLATFPGIFGDIPWNICEDIPRNVWGHSRECLATFLGMFEGIPRNVWPHSPKYSIPPIPRVPRIPFPVPVFLVLYIASTKIYFSKNIIRFDIQWQVLPGIKCITDFQELNIWIRCIVIF